MQTSRARASGHAAWDAQKGSSESPRAERSQDRFCEPKEHSWRYYFLRVNIGLCAAWSAALLPVVLWRSKRLPAPDPTSPERRIPRQPDYAERLHRATVCARPPEDVLSGQEAMEAAPLSPTQPWRADSVMPWPRSLPAGSAAHWLAAAPFRLVLAGGLLGMYEHLGRILALDRLGIVPSNVVGISSGAITGALVGTLPLARVRAELERLSIRDFLDVDLGAVWGGALCRGERVEAALEGMLPPDRRLLEQTVPQLRVAVYDLEQKRTRLLETGPAASAARTSAALPLLFRPNSGQVDGGWMDDQGRLWLEPGQRALQSRLPTGHDDAPEDIFTRRLGREGPVYALSEDPAHMALLVHIAHAHRLTAPDFLFDLDFQPSKKKYLVEASYEATMRWLLAPRAS